MQQGRRVLDGLETMLQLVRDAGRSHSDRPKALTVSETARRLGEPIHRTGHVIRSRAIKPERRAGNANFYSASDIERIAAELRQIDRRRAGESAR